MKKIVTIILVFTLTLSLAFTAYAANSKEIVVNGGFEDGQDPWVVYDATTATITLDDTIKHSGKSSMEVTDKTVGHGGVEQEITDAVKFYGKGTYHASAWIYLEKGETPASCSFVFQLKSSDEASTPNKGSAWALTALTPLTEATWVQVSGDVDFEWAADLAFAEIYIYFPNNDAGYPNYCIDDISLVKVGYSGADFTAPTESPIPTEAPSPTPAPPTRTPAPATAKPTLAPGQTEKPTSAPVKAATGNTNNTPITLLIGFLMTGGGILIGGTGMYFILKKKQVKVNEE